MSSKEAPLPLPSAPSSQEIFSARLLESFGERPWKVEEDGPRKVFRMSLTDPTNTKEIRYSDYEDDGNGRVLDLILFNDDGINFTLTQIVGPKRIENYIQIGPDDPEDGESVFYLPSGKMEVAKGGYPRKIDMDLTVMGFLRQVTEGRFTRPLLYHA